MKVDQVHGSHRAIVQRLKRAEGHLRTVTQMIEDQRPCLEIAQQLHAVEKAVSAAKKILIHDHINNCLDAMTGKQLQRDRNAVQAFKEITKYL